MRAEREGLDALLARYPRALLAYAESQDADVLRAREDTLPFEATPTTFQGPWLLVDLWEGDELLRFAIWRSTGAVYQVGDDGAVGEDPLIPANSGVDVRRAVDSGGDGD